MPLYDFKCEAGHKFERFVPLANFDMVQVCACQAPARRVISAPMFNVEKVEYTCPITGTPILSKRAHEDNLHRHDCIVAESGLEEECNRRREQANKEFDKMIEDHVEREIESWSSEKREMLGKELEAGYDVTIERTQNGN